MFTVQENSSSTATPSSLNSKHILRSKQFSRSSLEHTFALTDTIRKFNKSKEGLNYLSTLLNHKRVMLYFTQPSTRTFLSFQSACHILGTSTCEIRDASVSSEKKGESLEDSLRTFSSYVDLIIMRSPIPGLCEKVADLLDMTPRPVPIINAGSGPDEHPTQALLDLYTLNRSFRSKGGIDGKCICMVGDLKRGRTIRSLTQLLAKFNGIKIIFVSPKEFSIGEDLRSFLNKSPQIEYIECNHIETYMSEADAIYMTRIQDEYDINNESSRIDTSNFHLKYEHLNILKQDCIILHPMPRRQELDPRIDHDPRAQYWRQERNGMWTRVALMTKIFGVDEKILLPELQGH